MDKNSLRIPKRQMPVTLWVHPEGRVVGSMFLSFPNPVAGGGEQPIDVINIGVDFLVFKLDGTDEIRFYNKSSIVRVEYWDGAASAEENGLPQSCTITMMDGALFNGDIVKTVPEEHSRLYDYMNDTRERFLKLSVGSGNIALINKSYVVFIGSRESASSAAAADSQQPGAATRLELAD